MLQDSPYCERLLKLDGAGGFGGDVVYDAGDLGDFGGYSFGYFH